MVLVVTVGDTSTSNDDAWIDANPLESMKAPVSDRPLPPKQSGPINGSTTLKHVQPHAGFAYIVATEEQGDDNASDSECMRMMKEVFSIYTLGLTTSKELHDRWIFENDDNEWQRMTNDEIHVNRLLLDFSLMPAIDHSIRNGMYVHHLILLDLNDFNQMNFI